MWRVNSSHVKRPHGLLVHKTAEQMKAAVTETQAYKRKYEKLNADYELMNLHCDMPRRISELELENLATWASQHERRRRSARPDDRRAETAKRKKRPPRKGRKETPTRWLPLMRRRVRVKTSFLDDIAFTTVVAEKTAEQIKAAVTETQACKRKYDKLKPYYELLNLHFDIRRRRAKNEPTRDLELENLARWAIQ